MSKKGVKADDGPAAEGTELRVTNKDGVVVSRYMIEAGDNISTRRNKMRQFLRAWPSNRSNLVLARAQKGDWEELARHLEEGGEVTDEARKFLAEVLRGKKREVAHRPPNESVDQRNQEIAWTVLLLKESGVRRTAAKQLAADKFNLDFRSVQRASAKWESFVEPCSKIEKMLLLITDGMDEAAARMHMLGSRGISQDEVRQLITPRRR